MSAPVKMKPRRQYGEGKDGKPRLSVTENIDRNLGWSKPGLMWWAAGVAARAAIDFAREGAADEEAIARARKAHVAARDNAATAGTLTHDMIDDYVRTGVMPAAPSPWDDEPEDETRRKARLAFAKFAEWWPTSGYEVELSDTPFIDDGLDLAGTIDLLLRRKSDGARVIADIKTGQVHDEVVIQLGGYAMLLNKHGLAPDEGLVIHVPITDEPLRAIQVPPRQLEQGACVFGYLFMIHRARKSLALHTTTRGVP